MPSFSQAISILAAFALTSDTTTITTVVCTNDFKFTTRRETHKFSKKKNEAPRVCTYHNFVGSSKYRNCQKMEIKIDIGCGGEDVDDTTRMCKVTEHPWNDEKKEDDMDAAAAACVVHGSFDPATHITTDSATGFCHLKFLPLFDSCDVDVNGSPSGVFGMKAEIHNSRNTDNDDNSGLLLRFSHTGGTMYYNDDDPRETVPLHDIIPAERKLEEDDKSWCRRPKYCEKFSSNSTNPPQTCYKHKEAFKEYCWSDHRWADDNKWVQCDPFVAPQKWQVATTHPTDCGYQCTYPFQYINNDITNITDGMKTCEEDDSFCYHNYTACQKAEGTFNGWSCDLKHGKYLSRCTKEKGNFIALGSTPFKTCFGWGGPNGNRCWSESFHVGDGKSFGGYYPCVPRDVSYDGKTFKHWYVANPLPGGSCGPPCDFGFNEMTLYPLHNIGEEYDCTSYSTGGCGY